MDAVTALHEHYRLLRREQVFAAYRAVAIACALYALMGILVGDGDAHTAGLDLVSPLFDESFLPTYLAVDIILPQPPANTTYSTVRTMIYALI
jgi:hypothetical protein